MHDIYISQQIAREVMQRAKREGACRVLEVRIKFGKLTHLNPQQVDFWLREFFRDTPAGDAKILIKEVSPFIFCKECGYEGKLEINNLYFFYFSTSLQCPHCKKEKAELISGRECLLEGIKIEK